MCKGASGYPFSGKLFSHDKAGVSLHRFAGSAAGPLKEGSLATQNVVENEGRALNGRYRLLTPVGGGGMAQVYKARDDILSRVVAVKILREQYAGDPGFVARFRREAQAAANLAHPNIVNVYDVGQDGDFHYIVMEYIPGASLKELITSAAPLPNNKAINIGIQILSGLEYAHRNGLIHRDIKPQNVLISPDGAVKVTDFGIAKSVSDLGLTEAGLALGTAHYFSPEQAKGERVTPASDIYAVGVTMYEMLTGHLPFESDSVMGLAYKHISEAPPPIRESNPNVPARLEAIVLKALAKEPQERFETAVDMERVLKGMVSGGQQATMEVPAARPNVGPPTARVANGSRGRVAPPTGQLPQGPTSVPAVAQIGAAGGSTRNIGAALTGPSSMAVRRGEKVQSRGGGCSIVAIGAAILGVIALLTALGFWLTPQVTNLFQDTVIPSPTPTATVPTATPTLTAVPPTNTPTATPTNTSTPTSTPISVPVPKLVGLSIADAKVLAKQRGFNLVELERIDSPEWGAGIVAQQDPGENVVLQQTKTISVRVSNGPPPFKMPNLANTDAQAAKLTLESAQIRVQLVQEGSDTIPEGVVIRSDPPAETNVRPGDTIKLIVSIGEVATVPDLRLLENADLARERLESVGLKLGDITEVEDPSESVPPGAVLSQDPPKDRVVKRGTTVNIELRRRDSP
jgi:eukaryotic-like serine/threonine-protein kinase